MARSTVSDLVGRVLAGRYRLLASIGAGSSGRVFVADDVQLRRRVAVKVLHAALADDTGFLRRFRTEAQLAASLHHPNVMAVYDWGEDGVPFMVLELLAGGSLRGILDRGAHLSPAQAAHVGREVASALEYAHGRGLIHRDIKPANLLFDEHGILRVADFGLARALAEASWTEPAGAMLGTARYAAPEQAGGGRLDGRADLYSLGLVLVEAVSGRVPLVADSPFGTLARRQDRPVIAPREMGSLGRVVERVGRSNPDERYPDAATMGAALDDAIRALPRPAPLPLAGLGEVSEDPHPTSIVGTATSDPVFDQDAARAPSPAPSPTPAASRADAPRHRIAPFVLATVLVLTVAGIVFALTRPSTGAPVTVPNLMGMSEQAAQNAANGAGLLVSSETRNAYDPAGSIIGQRPAPGGFLGRGGTVHLVVSKGPKPVAVPAVAGKPAADAKAALEAPPGQFVVEPIDQWDEKVPKGVAIGTEPTGAAAPFGAVKLLVSKGPKPVAVPTVTGGNYDAGAKKMQDRGLRATPAFEFSDTVPKDTVTRTVPAAGTEVAPGTTVTIVVSKGPDLVVVPDFRNMPIEQANAYAAVAGVAVSPQGVVSGGAKVRAQDPAGSTQVKRGTVVTIFF